MVSLRDFRVLSCKSTSDPIPFVCCDLYQPIVIGLTLLEQLLVVLVQFHAVDCVVELPIQFDCFEGSFEQSCSIKQRWYLLQHNVAFWHKALPSDHVLDHSLLTIKIIMDEPSLSSFELFVDLAELAVIVVRTEPVERSVAEQQCQKRVHDKVVEYPCNTQSGQPMISTIRTNTVAECKAHGVVAAACLL